ncbi:MAG TPA: tetratricopeptide repeat protein, partial [Vicinamibacterales bacterium]|nr:tetratricopeptide repeat protein [Vicinamibacterales bacterium]
MDGYVVLLSALVALLAGLAIGKAWERYKLRDGQWIDRRRARESPHYMLGLNFLVANQTEPAIEELTRAAAAAGDPLEIHLILGNPYREKGQVGRAIQEHQKLLQRPDLRKLEHANVLLCLGLDYKRGGFVDRALEAFTEVLRLDPENQYALTNLEKLYEEQHQWEEAYATRHKLARGDTGTSQARHQEILAFLENELGLDALKRTDHAEAARRFEAAIDLDERTVPAYLNLGDVRLRQGDRAASIAAWERLIATSPDRAYLVFGRLEDAYAQAGDANRFPALCRRLIDANPQDWRARLALARHLSATDRAPEA